MIICIVLIIGFTLTAVLSYRANYRTSIDSIEQVSTLTTEGIYYQLTSMFARPVNISLTMSHDSLLVEHLQQEQAHLTDTAYTETIKTYLETYRRKYDFDSVFLVSSASRRYYNFQGVDRVLEEQDPENVWYFDLMDSDVEYSLNVDNDEVSGADNAITVFVNCKIEAPSGSVLGVVGVGIRIDYLQELLTAYEEKYDLKTCLVGPDGTIEISTVYNGHTRTDWFETFHRESIRGLILDWKEDRKNLQLWTDSGNNEKSFVVSRYIPELSWHLIVDQDTGRIVRDMQLQLYQTIAILIVVILIVLVIITTVIRRFNRQVTELMEERQQNFKQAAEQLYGAIHEFNITRNCAVGKRTLDYFETLGAKGLPYDQALSVIAGKQIKPEFQENYVSTFLPEHVKQEFERGNNHLQCDFMTAQDGSGYIWMRLDAYIFLSPEDHCLHMFTYRKSIDEEKEREMKAGTDEMTGFYTKIMTERMIESCLAEHPADRYAFFILDIDNFKQANDRFGHSFGDYCIRKFTAIIRKSFRTGDILGRIGGDEFVVFIPAVSKSWAEKKGRELSAALHTVCTEGSSCWAMSASIGIAMAPEDGTNFAALYKNADTALYHTKQNGKNGYTFFHTL